MRFTRNVASIVQDIGGFESVAFRALGGEDGIFVHTLAGTGVSSVDVDLAALDGAGDAAADTVFVDGTNDNDAFSAGSAGGALTVTSGVSVPVR